jgi:PAS domain S-box-containing protein
MSAGASHLGDLRLRAALESSPSGLLMIDAEGRIVLVNREVERLFGYPREEMLGRPVEMLVSDRVRGSHAGWRDAFFGEPRVRAMGAGRELFGRRKDGSEVAVEIGLTPVATDEGLFVISSIVDVSARRAADEARRNLEDQLRQAQKMEALGRLAGGVAHDFNNILANIVGYAELALESGDRRDQRADVEEVLRAADRGKQLVERILRFSRRQEIERRPLDLTQVVAESVRLLRATLPASVEIRVRAPQPSARILGDATSFQQVILNLANNAAQAMPLGGVLEIGLDVVYVRDSIARAHPMLIEGRHAILTVRDTGTGMDEITVARAFEPFFSTKPPGQGTGLGLALVHGIVSDHGGAVWIESAVGEGTTVACAVPAVEVDAPGAEPAEGSVPRGSGERILVVDDEPSLALLGERRLRGLGYAAVSATDPLVVMQAVRDAPGAYDAIVTDYSMPRVNGLELAREIHALRSDLPVLLVSGYSEEFSARDLAEAGVRGVLRKPISNAQLAVALRSVLNPGEQRTAAAGDEASPPAH